LLASAILGQGKGDSYVRFPVGRGVAGWVAQHRKTAVVADVTIDPRWIELPEEEDREQKRTGSMIVVPLVAHHELQGVLVLSHEETNYFDEHQRLVEAASNQIATGIHNALVYKQLEHDLLRRYEMQQAQEQAIGQSNAILQSLSDGVIVCDVFGSVITVNPAAEHILERPLEELLIWNMPELIRRMMGRRADELPIEAILSEPRDEFGRARMYSATLQLGTHVVSATLNPVLSSEKHTPIGALLVFRDITREVEADRLKTEFIGTVSHELRTPMTSIKGFTQLLVMGSLGPVNETQREFLNIIQTNSERMIAIINDLLDITKIETGSVELDMRPLHVAETISTVVLELQARIRERGHELAISIPPGLPLVRADQRRFNQILFNLLLNAIKYTPRTGNIMLEAREVGVDAVPEEQREGLKPNQRYVQIDVRDTGVGIAREEFERIFERFYRAENPLKVEAGGTGLGLSLVRPLLKLFSGRIWVASSPGEGSTFSLVVPACS
jgi:signal transduction histidine kinase